MEQLRDVRDEGHVEVRASNIRYRGYILDLVTDDLTLASTGGHMMREYIKHDDAVAVVPVREGEGGTEILLIRQYRHPTRSVLWEIPAGLLDKPGEDTLQAAERELAEETGMAAAEYEFLARFYTSPGCSDELLTVYLARGLTSVATDFVREDEEAEIQMEWRALDEVIAAVRRGDVASPTLVVGVLAAQSVLGA